MKEKLQKILYVEDDEDIAELICIVFEKIGHFDVNHCKSGKEALEVFLEFKPQIIVMDMMMPDMDGAETLKRLREIKEGKETPAVFLTAKAQTPEQTQYEEMGAIGVIMKPCDPMLLCKKVNKYWEVFCEQKFGQK